MHPDRLRKRADYIRVAKGKRWHTNFFSVQSNKRLSTDTNIQNFRIGYTVTKKEGNAVVRNRIKRRLKEMVRLTPEILFQNDCDYVLLGRRAAFDCKFSQMISQFELALKKLKKKTV